MATQERKPHDQEPPMIAPRTRHNSFTFSAFGSLRALAAGVVAVLAVASQAQAAPSVAERAAAAIGGRAVHEIDGRRVVVRGGGDAARAAVEAATGARAVLAGATPMRLEGARADAALAGLDTVRRAQLMNALEGLRARAGASTDEVALPASIRSARAAASALSGAASTASFLAASAASAVAATVASPAAPLGAQLRPGFFDTSEFLAGRVAVNVVFVDSTKAGRAWSQEDRDDAMSDLVEGLDMWVTAQPASRLSFTYRTFRTTTGLQPIEESSARRSEWIQQAMEQLGASVFGASEGSSRHYKNVYELNNRTRAALGTDWAFTVFFVRAANRIGEVWDAATGDLSQSRFTFADGQSPFAMLGGPYMVMPFSKIWGVHFWNAPILSHEMGHIFYARDEYTKYATEGHRPEETSGYFAAPNHNLDTPGAPSDVACIMRGSLAYTLDYVLDHIVRVFTFGATRGWEYRVCRHTLAQMGAKDDDRNGRLDVHDLAPELSTTAWISASRLTLEASAAVRALPNRNPYAGTVHPSAERRDLSVDAILKLRWRVAGGAWREALPQQAGQPGARFSLALALPSGTTSAAVEVEAITKSGAKTSRSFTAQTLRIFRPAVVRVR